MILENNNKRVRREINLIPLINVIFLLLTFFMVAGKIEKVEPFKVNLPQSSNKNVSEIRQNNIVYISRDGKIAVNNDFVTKSDFLTIMNTILLEKKDKEIVIKADSNVPSNQLVWVMGIIEKVGGTNISIITNVK